MVLPLLLGPALLCRGGGAIVQRRRFLYRRCKRYISSSPRFVSGRSVERCDLLGVGARDKTI